MSNSIKTEINKNNSASFDTYKEKRARHWDQLAQRMDSWQGWGGAYHKRLHQVYQFLIPPGQRVLEVGCGQGELLSAVKPAKGVGIDFSAEMVERARQKHPELDFVTADAHSFDLDNQVFDYIILSDLVNDAWDVRQTFQNLHPYTHPGTRIIVNYYSNLWQLPLRMAQALGPGETGAASELADARRHQ